MGVVPGIAIATSLVPPVATAGLSLCALDLDVALGATLLFLSNFISIVLGSAAALWAVGMRGKRVFCPFASWARRLAFGLFAIAVCLAVYFTARDGASVPSQIAPFVEGGGAQDDEDAVTFLHIA